MRHLLAICLLIAACSGTDPTDTRITDTGTEAPDITEADATAPGPDASAPDTSTCEESAVCDDGDPCTRDDRCVAGQCTGLAFVCDDGRQCTIDSCTTSGGCSHTIAEGRCLIGNQCHEHGTLNISNRCERCDVAEDRTQWSPLANLAPCDDSNPCTFADYCMDGTCRPGVAAACDDANPCTGNECNPALGCQNPAMSGIQCEASEKCDGPGVCSGGACQASQPGCDDANPCTTDSCLPSIGCAHVPHTAVCDDGDDCTSGERCSEAQCTGAIAVDCDDDNSCTQDVCDPTLGCYAVLVETPCCIGGLGECDDGNPCTVDDCDPITLGCSYSATSGPCDDGDPCTDSESCDAEGCTGQPIDCDDGNVCTSDLCDPSVGCFQVTAAAICDDGLECTVSDTCVDGLCLGDATACVCSLEFAATTARVTSLAIASKEAGLDLDEDGEPNNALSPLASLVNQTLANAVTQGQLVFLLELSDSSPVVMNLFPGTSQAAGWWVQSSGLSSDCAPQVQFSDGVIANGTLTAGGPDTQIALTIPLFGEPSVLPLFGARIEAQVEFSGTGIATMTGKIAGAIPKAALVATLETIDASTLPVPKENLSQLLDLIIENDIDTGPPTGADSASVTLDFSAVGVVINGVLP